jgi:hypothetical protein
MMKRCFAATALLTLASLTAAEAGDEKPIGPLPGVEVKLVISVEAYDPSRPSRGLVKAVIVNHSKVPVEVAPGYDSKTNRLLALYGAKSPLLGDWDPRLQLELLPLKDLKGKPERVRVKSGQEQVVFELSLDEIFFQGVKGDPGKATGQKWYWKWLPILQKSKVWDRDEWVVYTLPHPREPVSPVHRWDGSSFHKETTLSAVVHVNGQRLSSQEMILKVKARAVGRK